MPYSITVQSVAYLADHQTNDDGTLKTEMEAQAYYSGDVVDVYKPINAAPNPVGRLAFAHVTDIPDHIPFDEIREELTQLFEMPGDKLDKHGNPIYAQVFKRLWKLDLRALSMGHLLGIRGERVMHTDWETFASSYWYFDLSRQLVDQWQR